MWALGQGCFEQVFLAVVAGSGPRTSFLAVVACGRLPRATRPGPRLRTSYITLRPTSPLRDRTTSSDERLAPKMGGYRPRDQGAAKRTQRVGWSRKVRNRGPGRVALGRRPQATTAKKLVRGPTCRV